MSQSMMVSTFGRVAREGRLDLPRPSGESGRRQRRRVRALRQMRRSFRTDADCARKFDRPSKEVHRMRQPFDSIGPTTDMAPASEYRSALVSTPRLRLRSGRPGPRCTFAIQWRNCLRAACVVTAKSSRCTASAHRPTRLQRRHKR